MARRSDEKLDDTKRLLRLFEGDWRRLERLLGNKMTPTEFIRRLLRRTIEAAEERKSHVARNIPDVSLD